MVKKQSATRWTIRLAGATCAAMLACAAPLHAQQTNTDPVAATAEARVSSGDRELIRDIAQANLGEIDTGKLALEKSEDEKIRKFAQLMIDDHTKALEELRALAQSKGITLPEETDLQHKTLHTALGLLSGSTFDAQYIARIGIGDHERAEQLLDKTIRETSDQELKVYAERNIKVVQRHLSVARAIDTK